MWRSLHTRTNVRPAISNCHRPTFPRLLSWHGSQALSVRLLIRCLHGATLNHENSPPLGFADCRGLWLSRCVVAGADSIHRILAWLSRQRLSIDCPLLPFSTLHVPCSMLPPCAHPPRPLHQGIHGSPTTLAAGIPGQFLTGIRSQRLFSPYQWPLPRCRVSRSRLFLSESGV